MSSIAIAQSFVQSKLNGTGILATPCHGHKIRLRKVRDEKTRNMRFARSGNHCQCDCVCESPGDFEPV